MDAARFNILLVDDDPAQIDLARNAATEFSADIELTAVAGGDALLHWLSTRASDKDLMPHIIMMDLKLPKLEGLAVLRKLRGLPATRDIPILVCSSEYTQGDVLMSYKAGANSFVVKPADAAQCAELFRERLSYWMRPDRHKLASVLER
ncbi:MAG TPA: response regulator [Gallionella sp.]|nr:response regulator [Gallionella sp.]